jgi:hypothetical protein
MAHSLFQLVQGRELYAFQANFAILCLSIKYKKDFTDYSAKPFSINSSLNQSKQTEF